MQMNSYEQLERAVSEADNVLVGLGEEWVLTEEEILEDLSVKNSCVYKLYKVAKENESYTEAVQLLTAYYYMNYIPERLQKAYKNLLQLIGDKNYFVVSLCIDDYLKKIGFNAERCVNPCGTFEKLQCNIGCAHELESSAPLMNAIFDCLQKAKEMGFDSESDLEEVLKKCISIKHEYICEECGGNVCFNSLDAKKYRQEGYLEYWQTYMKWLQGTLNRKLCVIEAGVGMKLPSVIRWPFEKTVFYNQKSKMFRIHEKFYQINEEVSDRAYGCRCYSVDLFCDKNVEAFE